MTRTKGVSRRPGATLAARMLDSLTVYVGKADRPRLVSELPWQRPDNSTQGYVYVVEFTTGVVKIGRAKVFSTRLAPYADAAVRGRYGFARVWMSDRLDRYASSEAELVDWARRQHGASTLSDEYFVDLSFDATVARAKALEAAAPPDAEGEGHKMLREIVEGLYPIPCPGGCGCRWLEDADTHECGCDGPCTGEGWDRPAPPDDPEDVLYSLNDLRSALGRADLSLEHALAAAANCIRMAEVSA